jgi:hypothetical protein
MKLDLEEVNFLNSADQESIDLLMNQKPLPPFDDSIVEYLDQLSGILRTDQRIKDFPDVATFSFFCRRGNLNKINKLYADSALNIRKGRGLAFHICPSNVPVNFAFSFVAGLLAGNANLVRVPSKPFDQVQIILDAVDQLSLEEAFREIGRRIVFVRYDKNSSATKEFSQYCDARVIWGGDNTIKEVRKHPTHSRSIDVCFADRVSVCLIDALSFLTSSDQEKIINGFYNDTYLFDQNACTSPKLIIWRGSQAEINQAKNLFWGNLYYLVKKRYEITGVMSVDKLCSLYECFIQLDNKNEFRKHENLIYRVQLNDMPRKLDLSVLRYGLFLEFTGQLNDLQKIDCRKIQTLSYFGIDKSEIKKFIESNRLLGFDRVVPIGSTLDFSLNWDGYDLINTLSREIEII